MKVRYLFHTFAVAFENMAIFLGGNSSVGRAQPCPKFK